MTDDVLDDHLLDGRGSALLRLRLADDGLLRPLLRHRAHFLLSLALADELIHLTDERSLGNAHALRAVMQIGVAENGIHHHRDALHDGVDGVGTLQRVAFVAQQEVGLKLYEVGLMLLDVLTEIAGSVLAGEGVGVLTVGQQQHFQVHAFSEQHIGTAQGSMDAGLIAIVEQDDVRREAMQDANLMIRECRAGVGDDVLDARLMHGDDIGVAFHHVDAVFLRNGALGLIESVELAVFMIDFGVG